MNLGQCIDAEVVRAGGLREDSVRPRPDGIAAEPAGKHVRTSVCGDEEQSEDLALDAAPAARRVPSKGWNKPAQRDSLSGKVRDALSRAPSGLSMAKLQRMVSPPDHSTFPSTVYQLCKKRQVAREGYNTKAIFKLTDLGRKLL